jgi:hypothetical protein
MAEKIRFKRQYKPVSFSDPPDPRTVDGMRIAVKQRAEIRRFNRVLKDHEQFEQDEKGWISRALKTLAWWLTHLKFRLWYGRH